MGDNIRKMQSDLNRLIKEQNFQSHEELEKFMKGMIGKKIPEFTDSQLSPKEKAIDLVFAAMEMDEDDALENIEIALELDEECIPAWNLLAGYESNPIIGNAFYEKVITIGRKTFDEAFIKENKGHFWLIHETRDFMISLKCYAENLFLLSKYNESQMVLEEMMMLCKTDNLGARHLLYLILIRTNKQDKIDQYKEEFSDDGNTFAKFNYALNSFVIKGDTAESKKLLKEAMKANKFVVPMLKTKFDIDFIPISFMIGSREEAVYYNIYAHAIWREILGAVKWLVNTK